MIRIRRLQLIAALSAVAAPAALLAPVAEAQAYFGVVITAPAPPPPLPFYEQPPVPGPDYIWTPGYWAWDDDAYEYYWVPGTWVMAPEPGLLWTPGYWGWQDGAYLFHSGYWGPHVGFYGGVVYGFGYTGFGYQGGYWNHGAFFYNTSVNHVSSINITNVYNQQVTVNRTTINNVSFNGGPGGVAARPSPQEMAFSREQHIAPTTMQVQHQHMAASTPALFARQNGGHPPIAATARPGAFSGGGVVSAQGAHPVSGGPRPMTQGRPGGFGQPGYAQPGYAQPGYAQPGYAQPRFAQPGGYDRMSPNGAGQTSAGQNGFGGRQTYPGQAPAPQGYGARPPAFDQNYDRAQPRQARPAANPYAPPRPQQMQGPPRPPAPRAAAPHPHAPPPPKRDDHPH